MVLNAVVGFAGLPVTMAALEAGKHLALANKESLIAGAPVVQKARRTPGAEIVPVDSEHCAVHQCLATTDGPTTVARLVLTASGGPFRGWSSDRLAAATIADALAHPTWSMGPKITIDSSTLMNKGLEVIEAHELFGIPYERIEIVVHPQSIVHSMVELRDGSTLAQLSVPDMRLPIGYALGWPDRSPVPYGGLDWTSPTALTFEPPDRAVFRCIDLAYQAGISGGSAPAWLSAANEIAVEAFLGGRLPWSGIAEVVAETLESWRDEPVEEVEIRPGRRRGGSGPGPLRGGPPYWCGGPGGSVTRAMTLIEKESGAEPPAPAAPTGAGAAPPPLDREANSGQVVRLLVALALITAVFLVAGLGDLLLFIVILVAIVMLHELGHFLTAKWSGMKVTEYFVGFGPRLWSVRRGETEYGVKAIPAGGYVRITGFTVLEDVAAEDEPRAYRQQAFWKRIVVGSAGSAMHFLIAFVLALISVLAFGAATNNVEVQALEHWNGVAQTPAQQAGLRPGDVIVSVNGQRLTGSTTLHDVLTHSAGTPVTLGVERNGRLQDIVVTPKDGRGVYAGQTELAPTSDSHPQGFIGIYEESALAPVNPLRALGDAGVALGQATTGEFSALVHVFSPSGVSSVYHQVTNSHGGRPGGRQPHQL